MTEFIDYLPIAEEDRFPGLAEMLEDFLTPQLAQQVDPFDTRQAMAMYIDRLKLDLPIEIQPLRDEDNRFVLGTSPPTQWIDTSVQPVLHQLRLTLELDNDEPGNQTLEP
jgi:hypothetical protein